MLGALRRKHSASPGASSLQEPAFAERPRVALANALLFLFGELYILAIKVVPRNHPYRIWIESIANQSRSVRRQALRPRVGAKTKIDVPTLEDSSGDLEERRSAGDS